MWLKADKKCVRHMMEISNETKVCVIFFEIFGSPNRNGSPRHISHQVEKIELIESFSIFCEILMHLDLNTTCLGGLTFEAM